MAKRLPGSTGDSNASPDRSASTAGTASRAGPSQATQNVSPVGHPLVLVLCGGTSRRFGGSDKTRESLAGTTVLDHLLDTVPPNWAVVCVGQERDTTRTVAWCRESPPGGGPVAGIAAGLELHDADVCVVVGGDMPFAGVALPELVNTLTTQPGVDVVLAVSPGGRRQPLLAAYRSWALRAALPGNPRGARLMAVVDHLVAHTVACERRTALDVDTPEALEQARRDIRP